jgi:hypothetical protein
MRGRKDGVMPMKDGQMDGLRDLMVALLDSVRRNALQEGLSPLKQYDQITSRAQIAARTAANVGEFATRLTRSLGIATPSNSVCSDIVALEAGVRTVATDDAMHVSDVHGELMQTVTLEIGWFIARLRQASEARKTLAAERAAIMGANR